MSKLDKKIVSYLKSRKNIEIPLTEIEKLFAGDISYVDFAKTVKSLEENNILIPVKSHKTNNKSIPLHNTYRINKSYFKDRFINQIQIFKLRADENIKLESYFSLSEHEWNRDLQYIKLIDAYIKKIGFPNNEAPSPERSYEIMGDEKLSFCCSCG